jgi:hypothetical protein
MRIMIDFLNYEKYEIIMFVDYENNVYTKHHKTFSKKCVLENDFSAYQTHENTHKCTHTSSLQ